MANILEWSGEHFVWYGIIWFALFILFISWIIYAGLEKRSTYFNKYSWTIRLPLILFYVLLVFLFVLSMFANESHLPKILFFDYVKGALLVGTLAFSCLAIFRALFKRGTNSKITDFDGTWVTYSNESVSGKSAVDDGYNFMIMVLVFHQIFNIFSMCYLSTGDTSTSRLIQKYVNEDKRPVIPDGYKWRDYTDIPMALMVDKKWKVGYRKENRLREFVIDLEKPEKNKPLTARMTITIYPGEKVHESQKYRTYAYGFVEDLVNDEAGSHLVLQKFEPKEKDRWYRVGHFRQHSVVSENDSKMLVFGLADSGYSDVIVIKVTAPKENAINVFKSVEPTLRNIYMKMQLLDALL